MTAALSHALKTLAVLILLSLHGDPAGASSAQQGDGRSGEELPGGAVVRMGTIRFRHESAALCVLFPPDGKTLISAGGYGTVRVWEKVTGKLLREFKGNKPFLSSIALSPDGKILAVGGANNPVIRLWDFESATELRQCEGHSKLVSSLSFSPDGKTLVSASWDSTIRMWDVATCKELLKFEGHTGQVNSVAFSTDGKTLVSGGHDKTTRIWDATTAKELRSLSQAAGGGVLSIAVSPDGKAIASTGDAVAIQLWDPATGKVIRKLSPIPSGVKSVVFSPDGKTLASGSYDGTVQLWDFETGKESFKFKKQRPNIHSVAFSPDGKLVASGSSDGTICLWETATGKEFAGSQGHSGAVRSGAFSPDGKTLLTGSEDGTTRLWDVASGREMRILLAAAEEGGFGRGSIDAAAFSPDGTQVAAACGGLVLWEASTGKRLLRKALSFGGVNFCLAFSPEGTSIASCVGESIRLWEVPGGKEIARFEGHTNHHIRALSFSPDGRTLASACDDQTIRLWEVATAKEAARIPLGRSYAYSLSFSPDGKSLAAAGGLGLTRVWEVATGKEVLKLEGHTGNVFNIVFSPDGRALATAGWDKTIRLWDTATGKEIKGLGNPNEPVLFVAFSPDGRTLASGLHNGIVFLWKVPPSAPREAASGELEALWNDLAADPAKAHRAVESFAAGAGKAASFLKERLAFTLGDPERIKLLVSRLDENDVDARDAAAKELVRICDEGTLKKAHEGAISTEARGRIEGMLAEGSAPILRSGEVLRRWRALEALERIGTAEARETLQSVAKSARFLCEKREAEVALERLKGGGRVRPKPRVPAPPVERVEAPAVRKLSREEVRTKLTPRLLGVMTGLDERLASGGPHEWTKVFHEAMELRDDRGFLRLKKGDFESLAGGALAGAETREEKEELCQAAMSLELRSMIPGLIRLLSQEDEDRFRSLHNDAVTALGVMGATEAIPELIKVLKGDDILASAEVAWVLGSLRAKEAIPEFRLLLKHKQSAIRQVAAQTLGELEDRQSIPALIKLLDDPDAQARAGAATGLGALKATEAAARLVPLLDDPSKGNYVQWCSAQALVAMRSKESIPEVLKFLKNPNPQPRQMALHTLSHLGAIQAFPEIMALLGDRDATVRGAAVRAIGDLGAKEAVPKIVELLRDENVQIRAAAAYALAQLNAVEAGPDIARLLKDADASVRSSALVALGDLGIPAAKTEILKALEDPDAQVRAWATNSLQKLRAPEAQAQVSKLLMDPNVHIQISAAEWLCRMGSREGVPILLGHWDQNRRLMGLNALRQPEAFRRLDGKKLSGDLEGTGKEVVEHLAKEAGLALEWPASFSSKEKLWMAKPQQNPPHVGRMSLAETLETVLYGTCEAVLEPDRIRLLTRDQAFEFWETWWTQEEKK